MKGPTMKKTPADYLHLLSWGDGRDDNKPTLCGLNRITLYYDQATSAEHVEKIRTEIRPDPLCPNCYVAFSTQTGREFRVGYHVGNAEHAVQFLDRLYTEAEAKTQVGAMRHLDSLPGLRGTQISSSYFYERRPCHGCETPGQSHDADCTEWDGWVTWTRHNRRDYTVRGRNESEARMVLTRAAEEFAPGPLIQGLSPHYAPDPPAIEAKRYAEEHVAITYYTRGRVAGRLFHTHHPTIPYEVYAYNGKGGIDCKRVNEESDALAFVADFQDKNGAFICDDCVALNHKKCPNNACVCCYGDGTAIIPAQRVNQDAVDHAVQSLGERLRMDRERKANNHDRTD